MKNLFKIIFALCAFAALCLPACAQTDEAPPDGASATETPPVKSTQAVAAVKKPATKKKPAVKKKKKKKKKPVSTSEYKFQADEPTPTYKFDKKSDPILKPVKKKKKTKTGDGSATATPVPKLQRVKSIGEEDKPAIPGMPPGMPNIPGMGGK